MKRLSRNDLEQVNEVIGDSTKRCGNSFRSIELTEEELGSFADASLVYGVSSNQELLAICYASEQGEDIHIRFVGVREEASGRALGHRLLEHFCHIARKSDKRRLTLITTECNKTYYENCGFSLMNEAEIHNYDYLNDRITLQNKTFAEYDLLLPRIAMFFDV